MELKTANLRSSNTSTGPDSGGHFTLHAFPSTDIWRKPPDLDNFTAPIIYCSLLVSSFVSARVTAKGPWKTLYDQGGLFLLLPAKKGSKQKRWVKSGIEFYQNKPMMSVVAADEWADWSLLPLSKEDEESGSMTVEFEREREEDGSWGTVLRVLLVGSDGSKAPIREVTWAFWDLDENEEIWVGMYAAKPIADEREHLNVEFEAFNVKIKD